MELIYEKQEEIYKKTSAPNTPAHVEAKETFPDVPREDSNAQAL